MSVNTDSLNRTIFISDNLPFLKSLDTESVDLVVIDPPFGKTQTFEGALRPPLSDEEKRIEQELMAAWGVYDLGTAYDVGLEFPDQSGTTAKFEDIWDFRVRIYREWLEELEGICPGAWWLVQSTRYTHSDGASAYVAFMVERMLEVRRILKATGSVYLHCDHEANAYLRQMMDAVFGQGNFRNEIVWKRTGSHGGAKRWGPIHDTILFYTKSSKYKWNRTYQPYTREYVESYYQSEDEHGPYQLVSLTGPGVVRNGDSGQSWKGVNPTDVRRHWAVPRQSLRNVYPDRGDLETLTSQECLDLLDEAGLVYWPERGSVPRQKRYLSEGQGVPIQDIVLDISQLSAHDSERTGYPTQKPQALARRIIEASSNPGDLVLDCFAGCAYVPVAAELTGRRWIACDMSPRAWTVVRRQFHKQSNLRIETEGEYTDSYTGVQPDLGPELIIRVCGPNELPVRQSGDAPQPLRFGVLPEPTFRQRALEDSQTIWEAFVDEWGTRCWYCGLEKRRSRRELQLDHIEPNERDGSNDDCWNRALACVDCNGDKGDRLTVEQTMDKALVSNRIETSALRREQGEVFERRRQWATERWQRIKPPESPL